MFRNKVTREYKFSYGHRLSLESLTPEQNADAFGKCCSMHGHNARVLVTIEGPITFGMVVNFTEMDKYVNPIVERWDHTVLNELEEFMNVIPTAEVMSEKIWFEVTERLHKNHPAHIVSEVTVYENDRSCAVYTP